MGASPRVIQREGRWFLDAFIVHVKANREDRNGFRKSCQEGRG